METMNMLSKLVFLCFGLQLLSFPEVSSIQMKPIRVLAKRCGDPGIPTNGFRVGDDFRYKKSVEYFCDPGFILIFGSQFRFCQENEKWNGTLPTCEGGLLFGCLGQDKVLPCPKGVETPRYYGYRWRFRVNGYMKALAARDYSGKEYFSTAIQQFLGRLKVFANGSLLVKMLTLHDSGTFMCSYQSEVWLDSKRTFVTLKVTTCDQSCGAGFPSGMIVGSFPNSAESAIGLSYWCSRNEMESYIGIQLSKRYKISMISIAVFGKDEKTSFLLQSKYPHSWITFHKAKPEESTYKIITFKPIISQSLRIVVKRNGKSFRVCLRRAEVYGCNVSLGCIMQGSIVLAKFKDGIYKRAHVRYISWYSDYLEVVAEGYSGGRFPIFPRSVVVLDEDPSASELIQGTLVLGNDTSSHTIKKGKLKQKVHSNWQIEGGGLTWESRVEDIRVIKTAKFCA